MTNKPKIALVGCGGWGKNHARTWHELGALAQLCDASQAQLDNLKTICPDVSTTTNFDDVLKNPDIQGVVIATPSSTHATLASRAMAHGKDVLVEKPMALDSSEGERLVREAEQLGRILMVGHVLEYHPAVKILHRMIQAGELGKVFHIYSNRLNIGRIRIEENALWSFAPHDIALVLRFTGETPESVSCHGGTYLHPTIADMTTTHISFRGGIQAQIHVSWLHPFKEHRLVVVGSQQMAVFDDLLPWDKKLILYPHKVDWVEGRVPVAAKAQYVAVPLEEREPLREECREFLECIQSRRAPLTDGKSGVQVLKILQSAQRSLEAKGFPQTESAAAKPSLIHSSAVVDAKASVGEGTRIWHFSHVMAGAKVGKNCVLGQNVHVSKNVTVGDGVKIQNNVSLYEGVVLEDKVFCGPSMVFTNVMTPRSHVERKSEFRPTLVRTGATLGANCTIVCGNEIGKYAFVGAGSVVTKPVPDHALVLGNPARVAGWMCECGEKLAFKDKNGSCPRCQKTYEKLQGNQIREATTP